MAKYKIHFRTSLFLLYKAFWVHRTQLIQRITCVSTSNGKESEAIGRLKEENSQIEKCLGSMLRKLK